MNFERFGPLLDWAMIILSPMEPWPGSICLPAAEKNDVKIMADYTWDALGGSVTGGMPNSGEFTLPISTKPASRMRLTVAES